MDAFLQALAARDRDTLAQQVIPEPEFRKHFWPAFPAWRTATVQWAVPVLTALAATSILKESMTVRLGAAMALVVAGIWLTTRSRPAPHDDTQLRPPPAPPRHARRAGVATFHTALHWAIVSRMSQRTAPALAKLDELLPILANLPQAPAVSALRDQADALRHAIAAFHMEAIRFRTHAVDRDLRSGAAPYPKITRSLFDELRHALEAAGFTTTSRNAGPHPARHAAALRARRPPAPAT